MKSNKLIRLLLVILITILTSLFSESNSYSELIVSSVSPSIASVNGVLEVTIDGSGFTENTKLICKPIISGIDIQGFATRIAKSDSFIYLADKDQGMKIIDISNLNSLSCISFFPKTCRVFDVSVLNDIAYLTTYCNGVNLIDVSSPSSPSFIKNLTYGALDPYHSLRPYGIETTNSNAIVTDTNGNLVIADISNPLTSSTVGIVPLPSAAYDVVVEENIAYVAAGSSGLQIVDISNPAEPVLVGSENTTGYATGIDVCQGMAYIADSSSGLQLIDVSDVVNPQSISCIPTSDANSVMVVGNTAYVADGQSGLKIIDVSNFHEPFTIKSIDTPGSANDVHIEGEFAYIADGDNGLVIVSLLLPDVYDPVMFDNSTISYYIPRSDYPCNYTLEIVDGNESVEIVNAIKFVDSSKDIQVSPQLFDFESIEIGTSSSEQVFDIQNISTSNYRIESIYVNGENPSEFQIVGEDISNTEIYAGHGKTIQVVFSPSSIGRKTAMIIVELDNNIEKIEIPLQGWGYNASGPSIENYQFERMWPTLQQPWYFKYPIFAIDDKNVLYVTGIEDNFIRKFTLDGFFISKWGGGGSDDGSIQNPGGLAISDNTVYVTEGYRDQVKVFSLNGEFLNRWRGGLDQPEGIAVDSFGNVYVADLGNHQVQKFTSDGVFIRKWGSFGDSHGEFRYPGYICVDENDFVYVTSGRGRLQKFTPEGEYVKGWSFGSNGTPGVISDKNGYIYVNFRGTITKYSTDGEFMSRWNDGSTPSGHGDICIDSFNNVFFWNYPFEIKRFTSDGIPISKWSSSGGENGFFSLPRTIAVDSKDDVYIVDWYNRRIQKFSKDGSYIYKLDNPSMFYEIGAMAVDNYDNLYVYETSRDEGLHKFSSDGEYLGLIDIQVPEEPGRPFRPSSLLFHGSFLYAADAGYSRFYQFTNDGQYIAKWENNGNENWSFKRPFGIGVDSSDYIYISQTTGNEILKFTSDGQFVTKFGNGLNTPNGIAVDDNDNVFVANVDSNPYIANADNIHIYTSDGVFVSEIGASGSNIGQFSEPYDIAFDSSGKLYVSDTKNNRIQVFKSKLDIDTSNKAIIIAGGGPYPGNSLWDSTQMCANFAYRALTYQGFNKETIYYLSSDLDLDLDSNGVLDDVDGDVTYEALESAVNWASDSETLVVYLVDHGGNGKFRMSGEKTLSVEELDSLLDSLQENASCKVIVVYDACESGSFISNMQLPSGQERIILTSTSPHEPANFLTQGSISFSDFFWTHVFNGINVKDAFELASTSMSSYQTAMIDANGNGVGNEQEDKDLAAQLYIGNATIIYGESPQIDAVSPGQTVNNTSSADLYASGVTDADGISRVWAVIRPPDYNQSDSGNPVQELPSIDFVSAGNDRFEATYDAFHTEGTYHISVYARDRIGNTSIPKMTTVSVNNPLNRKAIIVAGGNGTDKLWPAVEKNARLVYEALKFQGYEDQDIYFMSPVSFLSGVDVAPSLSNMSYAVETWAAQNTQDLVICLIGNGNDSGFQISGSETLLSSDLNNWINNLQNDISGAVSVIYDACMSGSFIKDLAPPAEKRRILVSSTSNHESAMFMSNGDISFSNFFWKKVLNGSSILDAFTHAYNAINASRKRQTPLLDDSGNGIGNELGKDGRIARGYKIGTGIMLAGDDPIIGTVPPETAIDQETSALLWAQNVTTTGDIDRVWAVITPPENVYDSTTPVTELIELDLTYNADTQRYEATYNDFKSYGQYWISFYAIDADSNISMPMQTIFYKENAQVIGDVYPDGNLNLTDVVISLKHLTGMDMSGMIRHNYPKSGIDVNGDDKLGLEEVIYALIEIGNF